MSQTRVIGTMADAAWAGVVRPAGDNRFAAWIASRWAPPDRVRQRSARRDFRDAQRPASWLALSLRVYQPVWRVDLTTSVPVTRARQVLNTSMEGDAWHSLNPSFHANQNVAWTSLLRTAPFWHSETSVRRARESSMTFPVTQLWNRVAGAARSWTVNQFMSFAATAFSVLHTGQDAAERPAESMATHILRHQRDIGQDSTGVEPRLTLLHQVAAVRHANSQTRMSGAFQTISHFLERLRLEGHLSPARLEYGRIPRFESSLAAGMGVLALPSSGADSTESHTGSELVLKLRTIVNNAYSRPGMQFVQPAQSNQTDVVSAMRNVETAIAKVQHLQTAPAQPAPDVQKITAQVYDQLERQIRIERERRGR